MDGLSQTSRPAAPYDSERKRDDNAKALSAIRTAYGNLGMVKRQQEAMEPTNARVQLIEELSAVLDKLETSHELAKVVAGQ